MRGEILKSFFWIGVIGTAFSYFIYPLILIGLVRLKGRHLISDGASMLPVSLIVAAHNEESIIQAKIDNLLEEDYSPDQIEIVVASDASTDATDEIVRSYNDDRVRLVRSEQRNGKEFAQKLALESVAAGRIVVFSDSGTQLAAGSLQRISQIFSANSDVGAVSSEDRFLQSDGLPTGEGAYVRYEMWLRRVESRLAGLVGLSGSFFAARREVCEDWDTTIPSDFNVAMAAASQGLRSVSDPQVTGIYHTVKQRSNEYQRKVRTITRGMAAIASNLNILNFFRFGLFSFQVWGHKIMRWLVPWFFVLTLIFAILLFGDGLVFQLVAIGQVAILLLAAIGQLFESTQNFRLIRFPTYFVEVNLATVHATVLLLQGKRITHWKPSER